MDPLFFKRHPSQHLVSFLQLFCFPCFVEAEDYGLCRGPLSQRYYITSWPEMICYSPTAAFLNPCSWLSLWLSVSALLWNLYCYFSFTTHYCIPSPHHNLPFFIFGPFTPPDSFFFLSHECPLLLSFPSILLSNYPSIHPFIYTYIHKNDKEEGSFPVSTLSLSDCLMCLFE